MKHLRKIILAIVLITSISPVATYAATQDEIRAMIQSLMAQVKTLQQQLVDQGGGTVAWCHTFDTNLGIGNTSNEVISLAQALSKENISGFVYTGGDVTNFDEQIAAAVVGFQQKYADEILKPAGLSNGTGFVGAGTRAKLNKLYGCGVTTTPDQVGCTQDAKQCPDGSYVSRSGPKCEFTSCPTTSGSIKVVSPNGGETWTRKTTQTITWKVNSSTASCPAGSTDCYVSPSAQKYYDIALSSYQAPCTDRICPANLTRAPYTIAKNMTGLSFPWPVGTVQGTQDQKLSAPDGAYTIQVCQSGTNVCDSSDSYFKIVSGTDSVTPVISGVSGPTALATGQQGTWTVKASNPSSGTLSYSAVWGDEGGYLYGEYTAPAAKIQQTATFTHTYSIAGNYSPTFTVTNASGGSAQTSLSVMVGAASSAVPTISSITPSSGVVGTKVSLRGNNFTPTNNTVNFGSGVITGLTATQWAATTDSVISPGMASGWTLSFAIPSILDPACRFTTPACAIVSRQTIPGVYPVSVTNANGTSNALNFTIPSITAAPTISVSSPEKGDVWLLHSSQQINISTANMPSTARYDVVLYYAGGASYYVPQVILLQNSATLPNPFKITVPDVPAGQYYVYARAVVGTTVYDAQSGTINLVQIQPTSPPQSCTDGYDATTGYLCGCTSTQGYSATTGKYCGPTTEYPSGCTSTSGYSSTTGLACGGSSVSRN